jgi:hypothetical protein
MVDLVGFKSRVLYLSQIVTMLSRVFVPEKAHSSLLQHVKRMAGTFDAAHNSS